MAHKRMFSKDITGTDAFREMPSSTQCLYFHLGMEADDDGFLSSYKSTQRAIGSSDDDFKILVAKRFVLTFENGICVIKHWLINNTLRKDRYQPTKYTEEKQSLITKENGAYSLGIPNGNQMATIGKVSGNPVEDRIEEDRRGREPTRANFFTDPSQQVEIKEWLIAKGYESPMVELEIAKFINYWGETDFNNKPRWKKEKAFQIKNRFITWFSRIK